MGSLYIRDIPILSSERMLRRGYAHKWSVAKRKKKKEEKCAFRQKDLIDDTRSFVAQL